MKVINFEFRDIDGTVLRKDSIDIDGNATWIDMDTILGDMIKRATGKDERISGSMLSNEWMTNKKFQNGNHFFIVADNEFGFASAYLYRVI